MSNVQSQPLHSDTHRIVWNRVASVISWLIGVLFTELLLGTVAPALDWVWVLIIAASA